MSQTDSPIEAIAFRTRDKYIGITRQDGTEHGMYFSEQHARWLADLHAVPLTIDGEPA